jgi:hypothetical protein
VNRQNSERWHNVRAAPNARDARHDVVQLLQEEHVDEFMTKRSTAE